MVAYWGNKNLEGTAPLSKSLVTAKGGVRQCPLDRKGIIQPALVVMAMDYCCHGPSQSFSVKMFEMRF